MTVLRPLWVLLALGLWLGVAGAASAQEAGQETFPPVDAEGTITVDAPAEGDGPDGAVTDGGDGQPLEPSPIVVAGPDYAAWEVIASRAEGVVERGQGSAFMLRRLRIDLVGWRDLFLTEQSVNGRRIQTVTAQLTALGAAPAEGEPPEAASVAERRTALETQLSELRAPVRLAEEAHARADGLIREIDVLLRAQKRAQLMQRGPSPLNPMVWADVAGEVSARVTGMWKEFKVSITSDARRAVLADNWLWVVVYLIAAWALFRRGDAFVEKVAATLTREFPRGAPIWRFIGSLGSVVLPVAGVVAFVLAVEASNMFGFRATRLIETLPISALFYFSSRWLARQMFGAEAPDGLPQEALPDNKMQAQRLVMGMGIVLALLAPTEVLIDAGDIAPEVRAAFLLPFEIAMGVLLFRFGRAMSHRPPAPSGETGPHEGALLRRQMAFLAGRLIMVGSVVAPLLSVMGYGLAARALLYPTVLTLALLALVMLLQVLLAEVYAFVTRDESAKRDSLVPLLGGFALMLMAAPVVALIWGARFEDLEEVWTRFRDGYSIGDTRISPADLATFLIIFGVGFALTRLIQGILRSSILPKTKLDIGAQNAIISGLGYVGIFVAAMVAISTTGLNLSNVAIVAGALSVGIGFGLQTIVSNFVSGIILLIERPISEGDWIEVGGRMGYVRDISVRATRIETFDRTDVIVPNADLVSGQVVNWTRGNLVGRVIVAVSVVYGTDTHKVKALLQEIAEAHPMVLLTPPPSVVLVGFGPDVLNYEIRAIVRDVNFGLSVRSDMNQAIAEKFFAEGIEIAGMARANASPGRSALNPVVEEDGEAEPDAEPTLAQKYTHKTKTADGA
jgi:small-conductance mechanosensitive channel